MRDLQAEKSALERFLRKEIAAWVVEYYAKIHRQHSPDVTACDKNTAMQKTNELAMNIATQTHVYPAMMSRQSRQIRDLLSLPESSNT
jgi:hypothetical protein